MNPPTFDEFAAAARSAGYDEVLERRWLPGTVVGTHTHPFAVSARIVAGDLWLTVGAETRHLRAGDTFELEQDVPHDERYGDDGAVFWVGRRHGG